MSVRDLLPRLVRRAAFGAVAVLAWSGAALAQPANPLLPPVTPACVSSPFGPRHLANRPLAGTFHYGIDLPAPEGAAVHAIAPGTVIRIQRKGVGGLEMLIQHHGFIGIYSHLGRVAPVIAEGRMTVAGGEAIGTIGRTGLTYGTHLYFGLLLDGHPVDPAPFLSLAACGAPGHAGGRVATQGITPSRVYVGR